MCLSFQIPLVGGINLVKASMNFTLACGIDQKTSFSLFDKGISIVHEAMV